MNTSKLIALDADGVLLDYNLAYASAWERAFGGRPQLRNPQAYWAMDRWTVESLQGEALQSFRRSFDAQFWSTVPAIAGAVQACEKLVAAGYELVCVSALKPEFAQARQANLQRLGFPIERVMATSNHAQPGHSPKARTLAQLRPAAFVDDFLPYFEGVPAQIHAALILREQDGSPNQGPGLQAIHSTHGNLAQFADWWLER
ncbi:HAD family hydrolase [Comamonas guangdongensis]|uniref:HAD family hydrolase n=1 Tax=Comamonas guangdongensis TaxID=510515 RepID=A0ABV3ZV14_9BURK